MITTIVCRGCSKQVSDFHVETKLCEQCYEASRVDVPPSVDFPTEERIDAIGQNGGDGEHYSITDTLSERGERYGKYVDHAVITQNIKRAMLDSKNWQSLSDDKREALEMIAHKVGRILNGDPEYKDSWVDIEGYARLVSERLGG